MNPVEDYVFFHNPNQMFCSFSTQTFCFYNLIVLLLVSSHWQFTSKLIYIAYKVKQHLSTQFNHWPPIAYINKQLSACDSLGIAVLRLVGLTCGPSGGQWYVCGSSDCNNGLVQ